MSETTPSPNEPYVKEYACYSLETSEIQGNCLACGFCPDIPKAFPGHRKLVGYTQWEMTGDPDEDEIRTEKNKKIEEECIACYGTATDCTMGRRTDWYSGADGRYCYDYVYYGCAFNETDAQIAGWDVYLSFPPLGPECNLAGEEFFKIFGLRRNAENMTNITYIDSPVALPNACGRNEDGTYYFTSSTVFATEYVCGRLGGYCAVNLWFDLQNWNPDGTTTTGAP